MRALSVVTLIVVALGACGGDKFVTGDAGAGVDGGGDGGGADGGRPHTIACKGPGECSSITQACCLVLNQTDDQCIPRPQMPSVQCPNNANSLLLMCDDASDCNGGNVCCATRQNAAFSSACVQLAACNGGDRLVLCDPTQGQCQTPLACKPHPLIPRYYACQ